MPPAPDAHGSPADLEYLLSRLDRLFDDVAVVPHHALLYRLCEVGPKPFDPWWVAGALKVLTDTRPPRGAPAESAAARLPAVLEPSERLYAPARAVLARADATPTAPAPDTVAHATAALARLGAGWAAMKDVALAILADGAAERLRAHLGTDSEVVALEPSTPTRIGAGTTLPRPTLLVRARDRGKHRVHVWITHELPWATPDDPRLWARVAEAAADDAALLLVVRRASPTLFPALKAVGAAAVQVWWHLTDDGTPDLRALAADIGWLPVRTPDEVRAHAAWGQLDTCIANVLYPSPVHAARAAERREAALQHLAGVDVRHRAAALRTWARDTDLDVPARWHETVAAWETLAAGGLPPSPGPRAGAASAAHRAVAGTARAHPLDAAADEDGSVDETPATAIDEATAQLGPTTIVTSSGIAAEVDAATWRELTRRRR